MWFFGSDAALQDVGQNDRKVVDTGPRGAVPARGAMFHPPVEDVSFHRPTDIIFHPRVADHPADDSQDQRDDVGMQRPKFPLPPAGTNLDDVDSQVANLWKRREAQIVPSSFDDVDSQVANLWKRRANIWNDPELAIAETERQQRAERELVEKAELEEERARKAAAERFDPIAEARGEPEEVAVEDNNNLTVNGCLGPAREEAILTWRELGKFTDKLCFRKGDTDTNTEAFETVNEAKMVGFEIIASMNNGGKLQKV